MINSEKEYWEEFKKWKKQFKELTTRNFINNPSKYITEYERILKEGVEKQLISKEFAEEKIKKLYKELNAPSKFKEKIKEKLKKWKKE